MLVPTICSMVIVYFLIHSMHSNQTKTQLLEEIYVLEQEYSLIHERRVDLESHVSLLQPDHIDPDFLDEKSREMLGLMHEDEIVILH